MAWGDVITSETARRNAVYAMKASNCYHDKRKPIADTALSLDTDFKLASYVGAIDALYPEGAVEA